MPDFKNPNIRRFAAYLLGVGFRGESLCKFQSLFNLKFESSERFLQTTQSFAALLTTTTWVNCFRFACCMSEIWILLQEDALFCNPDPSELGPHEAAS